MKYIYYREDCEIVSLPAFFVLGKDVLGRRWQAVVFRPGWGKLTDSRRCSLLVPSVFEPKILQKQFGNMLYLNISGFGMRDRCDDYIPVLLLNTGYYGYVDSLDTERIKLRHMFAVSF